MSQYLRVELSVYMGGIVFSWIKLGEAVMLLDGFQGCFHTLKGFLTSFRRVCEVVRGGDQPHRGLFPIPGGVSLK